MSDAELDQFLLGLLSYLGISCRLHVFRLHFGAGPDNAPDLRLMSMVDQLYSYYSSWYWYWVKLCGIRGLTDKAVADEGEFTV